MLMPGDIIEFKGQGFLYRVLSWILRRFEPEWDGWGWHLAFVVWSGSGFVQIMESTGDGCQLDLLDKTRDIRVYHWFDEPPSSKKIQLFISTHLGKNYDVGCYFWTALQYLVLHFFNHAIPRLLDERFTCWELTAAACRALGKPLQPIHEYPMLPDILRELRSEL